MNLNEIRDLALMNRQYIRKKVDEFIESFEFLEDLPHLYYVSSFKVEDPEDRAKMKIVDFHEKLIEFNTGNDIFYYNYVEKKMYHVVEFFFSLIKKDSTFPPLENIYQKCLKDYDKINPNIRTFELKGLRQLLEDAHNFKIPFYYNDYLSIIKGHDKYLISEDEFNQYKEDVVGDYVVENAMTLLNQGAKKKFDFNKLRKV